MKNISQRKNYCIFGFLFVTILGTLSHFIYDISGKNRFLGLFFPVGESTWEHMKLAFIPALLYIFLMRKIMRKEYPVYTFASLCRTICGVWLIPFFCFFYRGVLGFGLMWVDIVTFFLAILCSFCLENHILKHWKNKKCQKAVILLGFINGLQMLAFMYFTYHPSQYGIFQVLP